MRRERGKGKTRAAARESFLHDDALRLSHALGRRDVPAEQQLRLIDEFWRDNPTVTEARDVFAEAEVRRHFRQIETTNALIFGDAILKTIKRCERAFVRALMRDAPRKFGIARGVRKVFADAAL